MPPKKGQQQNNGKRLRNLISRHFEKIVDEKQYLERLSTEHPAVYISLVNKVIPAEVNVSVEHHVLDLGLAMKEAGQRLALFNENMKTIEHNSSDNLMQPLGEHDESNSTLINDDGGVQGGDP